MADSYAAGQALARLCERILDLESAEKGSVARRPILVRYDWLRPEDARPPQSIREGNDVVTVTLVPPGSEDIRLPEPLGRPWRPGATCLPTLSLAPENGGIRILLQRGRKAEGLVSLWIREAGMRSAVIHMASAEDDPQTIALALGKDLRGATVEESRIVVPGSVLEGRVSACGELTRVTQRFRQRCRVSVWTDRQDRRETIGLALEQALCATDWLDTGDERRAQLLYRATSECDEMRHQSVYRRDMICDLVMDRVQTRRAPRLVAGGGVLHGENRLSVPWGNVPA